MKKILAVLLLCLLAPACGMAQDTLSVEDSEGTQVLAETNIDAKRK